MVSRLGKGPRFVCRFVSHHRVENSCQSPCQRNHGHSSTSALTHANSPYSERGGVWILKPQHADRDLHQQPSHPSVSHFGDSPSVLFVCRAHLTWHKSQVSLKLMRFLETTCRIYRSDEGRGGDRSNARHGAKTLHLLVLQGQSFQDAIQESNLLADMNHDGQERPHFSTFLP